MQQSNLVRAPRGRAGRPTREEAEQRRADVLDVALEVFLDRGYEGATVDMIAAAAGASKRTLYAHYEDKTALFKAAVRRAIERYAVEAEKVMAVRDGDEGPEETLTSIARMRIAHVMSPVGQRLQRILAAEAFRFPEIYDWSYEQTARPMIDFLANVLRKHADQGLLDIEDPERTAMAFMSMVVSGPTRAMTSGVIIPPQELDERVRFTVHLFLRGVLSRDAR